MQIEERMQLLWEKDEKEAYEQLLELEKISKTSKEVYSYLDDFIEMLESEKSYIRVRGFRLICKNARWDGENRINKQISKILEELEDEKPTAVRQCLQAITELIENKKECNNLIKEKLLKINYAKYKKSMQSLIFKDVEKVLLFIEERMKKD